MTRLLTLTLFTITALAITAAAILILAALTTLTPYATLAAIPVLAYLAWRINGSLNLILSRHP